MENFDTIESIDEKGLGARIFCVLLIVFIAFICLIWRFFPFSIPFKVFVLCLGGAYIFYALVSFYTRIPYFISTTNSGKLIAIVCIVFLLFPSITNILYESSKQEYLSAITPNTVIGLKITYDVERTGGSGSIGSEWKYRHYFNDIQFKSGDILEIKASDAFTIRSRFIETDDAVSDVGETSSAPYTYHKFSTDSRQITIQNDVIVIENGGRRYAGSFAEFTATYHITLTVPPSISFWDIYFNTADISIRWVVLICQLICLAIVAYVIIGGNYKKKQIDEKKRIALEKKKQEEKEAFIQSLNGKTIREIAGVPSNISYESGLPKDNNNQCFGSYTVYTTKSGSCFHRIAGCCSARFPIHSFIAMEKYKPCSKCGAINRPIPAWHKTYIELVKKCKEYSIEFE